MDDDEGHIELVRRNLKRSGINNPIQTFTRGEAALDFVFRRGPYADVPNNHELLILLDINMPGLDGAEVLRQIKANEATKAIPVIMLTTTDDPREINRFYALGCAVYIVKPVDSSAFIEAIHRLGLFISVVSLPQESGGHS